MAVVKQPVQQRCRHNMVSEYLSPFAKRSIAGDHVTQTRFFGPAGRFQTGVWQKKSEASIYCQMPNMKGPRSAKENLY